MNNHPLQHCCFLKDQQPILSYKPMDQETLELLEFPKVLKIIQSFAQSSLGVSVVAIQNGKAIVEIAGKKLPLR